MKTLAIALCCACSTVALAQNRTETQTQAQSAASTTQSPASPPRTHLTPAQHMANLAVLLDLTDEQKPQVAAVLQQEHEKVRAQFEQAKASGTRPSFEQMKALHEQIQQDAVTQLSAVLNQSQLQKFKVLLQERASAFPGGHPPGPPH